MGGQLIFFRKNWADYEKPYVAITASDSGPNTNPGTADSGGTAPSVGDRSNNTGWGTTGSQDSYLTQLTVNFGDLASVDTVLLVNHNFASVMLSYWSGVAWVVLTTVNGITATTTQISLGQTIQTSQLLLQVNGTQVANSDKFMSQFIAVTTIGQLAGWPVFKKPTLAKNIVQQQTLSGKNLIVQNKGFYSTTLSVDCWSDPTGADMTIVEALYNSPEGFLFWPCGGNQAQFRTVRLGYTLQDIFLCRCVNEFSPEWYQGFYQSGMAIEIDLAEVIT